MISTALLTYVFIGPLPWVVLWIGTLMGRSRMGRLVRWRGQLPADPPHVTVLVPAKDESACVRRCIESVLAQQYPSFNVIAINDRSSDATGVIMDEIAARDSRLRVIHIQPQQLRPGWLGKCNALDVASREATGEWLLLVDSDVTLSAAAMSSAVSIALQRKYDAVSILTRLECHSFLEHLLLPLLALAWAVMHTISQTNVDSRKRVAAANGQFFLIRRSAYESVGGHAAVKDRITEDVELMRLLKSRDFTTRFFTGSHLASTRMHTTLRQMFHGWARIYSGTSRRRPWRILGAVWFVLTAVFTVYPAVVLGARDVSWLSAATLHLSLMTAYLMMIYRMNGNPVINALLAPVSAAIMLAVFVFALVKCYTGQIIWRDTQFTAASKTAPPPAPPHRASASEDSK